MSPREGAEPAARTGFTGVTRWLAARRGLLSRLLLVAGVLAVVEQLLPYWPRQIDLELDLGARHGEVTELRLAYLQAGEELKGVSLRYAGGAPTRVRHSVSLPKGPIELSCELRGARGASSVHSRTLQAPGEGVVRVALAPDWPAPETGRP